MATPNWEDGLKRTDRSEPVLAALVRLSPSLGSVRSAEVGRLVETALDRRAVSKSNPVDSTKLFAFTKAAIGVLVKAKELSGIAIVTALVTDELKILKPIEDVDKASFLNFGISFHRFLWKLGVEFCGPWPRPEQMGHWIGTVSFFATQATAQFAVHVWAPQQTG